MGDEELSSSEIQDLLHYDYHKFSLMEPLKNARGILASEKYENRFLEKP